MTSNCCQHLVCPIYNNKCLDGESGQPTSLPITVVVGLFYSYLARAENMSGLKRRREIQYISRASIALLDCAALESDAGYGRLLSMNKA